uniref:Uncharacterized protein n=1 Tax=Aegilops tauschii subsp. strangulata TaxID=200361 RepID=A0A453Q405_AEGTS
GISGAYLVFSLAYSYVEMGFLAQLCRLAQTTNLLGPPQERYCPSACVVCPKRSPIPHPPSTPSTGGGGDRHCPPRP